MKYVETDILPTSFYLNKGYKILHNALDVNALDNLKSYIEIQEKQTEAGFYTSIWVKDENRRNKDFEIIINEIWPFISSMFPTYEPIMANFMIKSSAPNSQIGFHQDWTFTEEKVSQSFNIWFPLQDITIESGPLKVIPCSHRINNPYRGKLIEQVFEKGNKFLYNNFSKALLLKKGDAVIFDTRLIHFSEENYTGIDRIGASIVISQSETKLIHYYKESRESRLVKQINIDKSFFVKYALDEIPNNINSENEFEIEGPNALKRFISCIEIALFNFFLKPETN